jgi:hypothetical protein
VWDEASASERLWTAASMAPVAAILLVVGFVFGQLHIEVRDSVRFRFGPFGPTQNAVDIQAASAEPYRWLAFGGWGIRFGRLAGRTVRAYSVPFWRTGVTVELRDGKRYYISSRRPDALAAAVQSLAGLREGQA